jgi:hypothetical protein
VKETERLSGRRKEQGRRNRPCAQKEEEKHSRSRNKETLRADAAKVKKQSLCLAKEKRR